MLPPPGADILPPFLPSSNLPDAPVIQTGIPWSAPAPELWVTSNSALTPNPSREVGVIQTFLETQRCLESVLHPPPHTHTHTHSLTLIFTHWLSSNVGCDDEAGETHMVRNSGQHLANYQQKLRPQDWAWTWILPQSSLPERPWMKPVPWSQPFKRLWNEGTPAESYQDSWAKETEIINVYCFKLLSFRVVFM